MLRLRQVFDLMNLVRFLGECRSRREAIARGAKELMTFLGEMAYDEARTRARACRHRDDRRGDRHWSKVAVEITRRTGREIGVKAADRYEQDSRSASRVRNVHEVATRTNVILLVLADIARGNSTAVSLQNVSAHVRNAVEFAKNDPEVARAGDEVRRLAVQLAAEVPRSAGLIQQGAYPLDLHNATQAVEQFGAAMLRSLERCRSASSRA